MDRKPDQQLIRDQHILERLRNNDQLAWREVYEGNRSKVVHYLRKYGTSEETALEIYQDTLIFLDERKHKLELTSQLSTYLTGVAIIKQKARWKAEAEETKRFGKNFEHQLTRPKPADSPFEEDELNLLQMATDDTSLFHLDTEEPDMMLQKALTQVRLKHCVDLFQMVFHEDLDQKVIADKLGLTHGTVRNQLLDCKKKTKEILLNMGWGQ